jgi:putative aldouronate transport system substrate-binding protein
VVAAVYGLYETPLTSTGYFLRQDWLDELDLGKASDLVTFDDLYEVLTAFKAKYGPEGAYPMMIFNSIELQPVNWVGYNTTPYTTRMSYTRVVDGEVQFCGTTGDDKALMTMLNQWWKEGLIDPNYASYSSTGAASSQLTAGNLGYVIFTPSEVPGFEASCVDKDCRYEPVKRLKQYKDQIIQWGLSPTI